MKFSVVSFSRAMKSVGLRASILALASSLLALPAAWAEDQVTQEAVINAIASGSDASGLLRRVDNRGAGGASIRNTTGKQLAQSLNLMLGAVNSANVPRIQRAYEQVRASAMLAQSDSNELKTRLADPGLPSAYEARRAAVEGQLAQLLQQISSAMPGLEGTAQQKSEALGVLRSTLEATRQSQQNGAPVLRIASLPVRPLALAARAPRVTPVISPSYLATQEIAVAPEDIADAPEAPLSEEILGKAKELGYDYVRIYEYVRNNIRSEWYTGSVKGALGAFRTGSANSVDQASLLVAMMRAAGAPARYVQGVAEVDVNSIASAAGLRDATLVPDMLTRAGIAFSPVVQGGRVALVRIEHTWVTVQVPYTNYRGIVLDASGKTWLPLDVFFKNVMPQEGGASFASLGLDLQTLSGQYRASVQPTDFGSYVRERANAAAASAYDTAATPPAIKVQALGLLPNTLGFGVVAVTGESAALPEVVRSSVRIRLFNNAAGSGDAGLDVTLPVHELFNQRATINYIPAELADHRAILLAGGQDLAPIYLFRFRPELRLDGFQRNVGLAPLAGGDQVKFRLDLQTPVTTESVEQTFVVGAYHAIGVGQGGVARNPQRSVRDSEYDAARLLDGIVQRYESQLSGFESAVRQLGAASISHPTPSVTIVSNALNVYSVNSVPYTLEWKGVTMDAATRATEVTAADAATARMLQRAIGLAGSSLEQGVFASQFGVDSVSADKLIALAHSQNIPVRTLNSPAAPEVSGLPLAEATKTEIRNWLQSGYTVEIPTQQVSHEAWSGMGWIVSDPTTGASGYYLSGGIAGGATAQLPWTNQFLADALAAAHSDGPNNDPLSGVSVELFSNSAFTKGIVGQALANQPLSVRVRDREGRPVKGASVNFTVLRGGGQISPTAGVTNALGVATATMTLGQSTAVAPVYMRQNNADKYLTQVGINSFDVSVASNIGTLKPDSPAVAYAFPDVPASIKTKQLASGSAMPGVATIHSSYSVEVLDKFSNPVANVQVKGTGLAATNTCDPVVNSVPATVDGPYESDTFGVAFLSVTPGPTNGTVSPVSITAGSISSTIEVKVETRCSSLPVPYILVSTELDKDGLPSAATGVGKRYRNPFTVKLMQQRASLGLNSAGSCTWLGTRRFEPAPNVTASPRVKGGGSAVGLSSIGPGEWQTFVVTGASPNLNQLGWQLGGTYTVDVPMSPGCGIGSSAEGRVNEYVESAGSAVFGVRVGIESITSMDTEANVDASRLYLSDAGFNTYPIKVEFKLEPEAFKAYTVQMRLFENNQLIDVRPSVSRQKKGDFQIERGNRFDISNTYQVDAYIADDIISEPKELPFKQRIVSSYDRVLRLLRDVDIANDRFCAQGSALNFVLSQSARITLEATALSDDENAVPTGTPVRLVDGQAFPMGAGSIPIAPDALLPTKNGYAFTLTAVSDKDGSVEPNKGTVISKLLLNDALPVGNILINGVNVKSGRISLSGLGMGVAARGPQLALRPSYSSGGSGGIGVLGVNWGHNFDASLSTTACGDILVNAGDGGFVRFLPQGNGALVTAKGYHGTLVANGADHSYVFYSKDGTRYHFAFVGGKRQWALQSITDTNGNALTLTYDIGVDAPLLEVRNAYGQGLYFHYQTRAFMGSGTPANVLEKVQGPEGMGLAFEYDSFGNLAKITRTDIPEATESFSYSDYSNALGAPYLMQSHTNPLGKVTRFSYNSGAVMRKFGNGQIPSFESTVVGVTTPDGAATQFAYNANPEAPATAVTDARGAVTNYTFNKYGSPLVIAGPAGTTSMTWATNDVVMLSKTDANGVVTRYTYDDNGNQTSEQVEGTGGGTTTQQWAAQTAPPYIKNRRLTHTDRRGLTTTYSYDDRGNLTGEQRPDGSRVTHTVATNGDRQSTTDARGKTTTIRYDDRGMRSAVVDPMGGTTTSKHDGRGREIAVVDAEGRASEIQYNALDLVTQVSQATGTAVAGQKTATWDAAGNKLSETDEEGRSTTYVYDAMNRVVRKSLPLGSVVTTYDLMGNKTSETNLRGDVTTYEYDAANRLVRRTEPAKPPKVTGYAYDGVGNILTETDALGRSTTYTYDVLNRRTTTQYVDGTTSRTAYDGNGNKISETDALGRVTSYEYDNANRLLSQTIAGQSKRSMAYDANGNLISRTDANGNATRFDYDALNRVIAEADALGLVTDTEYDRVGNKLQVTNPLRHAQKWQYNARNWVMAEQDAAGNQTQYSYDKVGNRLGEVWANGNNVSHEYDSLNRRTRSSDSLGLISSTAYDADGNVTRTTDGRGNSIAFTWDAIGRQLSRTQTTAAGEAVTSSTYDAVGNLVSLTGPNGNTVTTQYDNRNRPVRVSDNVGLVSSSTYDAVGNTLTQTDGRGRVQTHQYNDYNLRISTRDGLGLVSSITYDLHGNKVSEADANGHTTSYVYDKLNRITQTTHAGVQVKKTEYDEAGRVQYETDARGNKVGFEYDKRGLLVKTNRSLGAIDLLQRDSMGDVVLATDPEGRTTATQYDARRRATRVTDGVGNATQNTYDLAGNLTEVKTPLGGTTTYTYDSANRLVSIAQSLATTGPAQATRTYDTSGNLTAQADLNGNTTGYSYDARNRRIQKTLPGGAQETNGYDGADGLIAHTDANGNSFTHTLDERGRRTQSTVSSTPANSLGTVTLSTFSYDANGNLTSTALTDNWGKRTETTTYDAFNRPVKVTDAWGNSLTHTYDAQGNRVATTASAAGSTGGSVTTIEYDALNRATSQTGAGGISRISYDKSSRVISILHPDNSSTTTSYDKAGRTASEASSTQTAPGAGSTIRASTYQYDANGNRTSSTTTESLSAVNRSASLSARLPGGPNTNAGHSRTRVESWTYDTQDRLTSHTTPERTTTWQLDAGGRRIQQTVVATAGSTGPPASTSANANPLEASAGSPLGTLTYSYNSRDQLTQISGAQSTSYTYDAAGNRLSQSLTRSGTTQTTRYRWNAQDQLVQVEQGSGSNPPELLASYRYSADNLRAEKQLSDLGQANASQASAPSASPLAYERTQWDGLHARRSFEITGANNTQTLRSDTDAAVLAGNTAPWLFSRTEYTNGLGSSSRTTQLHADSQGTLIATVVSESGAAKADSLLHYSAYGLIDSEASGNAGTGLRSNGHSFGSYYADPETGLLYARARYFDPASGQFVSRDPEEGEANLPITWGAYQYGRYSPYRYNDPNGKCDYYSTAKDCATEAAGGLVGAVGLTALKAAEGAIETLKFAADGYLGVFGNEAAQQRNSARLDLISGVIDNADKIPGAVKQAIINIDDKAQAEDAAGNKFTAAMLRGNYVGEITLAIAALPQAARSAVSLADTGLAHLGNAGAKRRVVARAIARELDAAEPALASKTPSFGPDDVRPVVGPVTPDLVTEAAKLGTGEKAMPPSKTARATPSEPCCFAPGTLVATEAGERPIETIEVGDLVWTRLEDGTGQAFLAPVTAIHIRHDRPILRLSVEQVQTGEPGEATQPTTEDLLVTPGHPFYVAGQGFVSVEDLQQGDELVSLGSSKTLRVKSLVLEAPQGTTHNLTVDKGHTFFVGNLGTWAHNVGPCNTCPGGACGRDALARSTERWTPHPEFQQPAPGRGQFLGDIGNSPFSLSDEAAAVMGVPRGSVVPWMEGVPDFGKYTVSGPAGMQGQFSVKNLMGDHGIDKTRMLQHMASETGLSQRKIKNWLSTNNVALHHAGGDLVQIVPIKIHQLHHSGGAQKLRDGN